MTKESGYFAFPFAIDDSTARVEISGGMIGTGLPLVPGSALHMRAARRWVSFEDKELAVALAIHDAPLIQMGGISLPYAPFPQTMGELEPSTVYSWIYNNIWDTNFPPQQGFEMNFKYSVGAAKVTAVGESGPALGARVAAGKSRRLRAILGTNSIGKTFNDFKLVSIEDPRVRLVGMTSLDDGRIMLRLQSFANSKLNLKLKIHDSLSKPFAATFLGEELSALEVKNDLVEIPMNRLAVGAVIFTLKK
jgi:hypothetical protein